MNDTSLSSQTVREILHQQAQLIQQSRDLLDSLDSALGDGDLGISMSKAFTAIENRLQDPDLKNASPGELIVAAGQQMIDVAPSTFGTLLGLALIDSGRVMGTVTRVGLTEIIEAWEAMAGAIERRGKATIGDKTILDVLVPIITALKEGAGANAPLSLEEVVTMACDSAKIAFDNTIPLVAKHGRAGRFRERSIGHPDAGAMVGVLLIEGFRQALVGLQQTVRTDYTSEAERP